MQTDGRALAALAVAAVLSGLATPVMAQLARRAGILDYPVGYKRHGAPTPYLGGVAILIGVVAGTLAFGGIGSPIPAVVASAAAVCLLGTLDDWRPISPLSRMAAHAVVGGLLWLAGAGWSLDLPGWANCTLTVGWVVVATNVFNLIDNLDGTSAGAAVGSAMGTAIIALDGADVWPAVMAAAVVGAAGGFLPYNLSRPARIFLGDGGSNLLGLLIAVAAMAALPGESGAVGLIGAALLVGAPVVDAAVTLAARRRRGILLLTGGRDHVTHRILRLVGSARTTAMIVAAAQLGFSAAAVAVVRSSWPAAVAAAALPAAACAGLLVARGGTVSAEPTTGFLRAMGAADSMSRSSGVEARQGRTGPQHEAR
jgi:UDP-GlcNAc:undecaprenyl-phosphate/decaprenyl-phosphate GlcNAc-1-phosphate transferase